MEELTVAIKLGGAVLLLWLAVVLLRKVGNLYWALNDIFLFWSTAVGSRDRVRNMKRPMRIQSYLARTEDLDTVSIEELYTFVKKMVEGPSLEESVIMKSFQTLVLSYTHVLVCRERLDGSLRGIMLIGVEHKKQDALNYTLIKLGLVMFLPFYRGGPWMYWILLYLSLKELVLHPFTPLYHGGKAYSYKSYLIATQFSEFYPRHDKTTPPFAKAIMDDMAYSVKLPSEYYNEEASVLHREYSHLKEYVAPVTEDELKNPHIKFFVERNPGWMKGHCLMTLYKISWKELLRAVFMAMRKSKVQNSGPKSVPQSRIFKRGTSYQSPGFSVCAAAVRAKGLDHLEEEYAVNSEDEDVPFMMTAAV